MSTTEPVQLPDCYAFFEPDKKACGLVVLFHGYRRSGKDMITLAPYLQGFINQPLYWYAPNGISAAAKCGYQWFAYSSGDYLAMQKAMQATRAEILKKVEDKAAELGIQIRQVYIAGFSQGGMVALDLAAYSGHKFGGVVCFSGVFLCEGGEAPNIPSPICLIHGKQDEVVPISLLRESEAKISAKGSVIECHQFDGLKHSIDDRAIRAAGEFINARL